MCRRKLYRLALAALVEIGNRMYTHSFLADCRKKQKNWLILRLPIKYITAAIPASDYFIN
jgi:hypothetical protein